MSNSENHSEPKDEVKEEEKSSLSQGNKKVSPYHLNNNDNPGNIITQVQLHGENYDEWASAMRTSLRARRKWGFVEGTVTAPAEDSPDMEDWWTVQSMIVSWILNTIEPVLRSTISYAETAKEMWEDIKERFSVTNGPRIQQLKSDLASCKQGGMTVMKYYGKLKILWDELGNYEQIPACSCGGCKCNIASKLVKKKEEEKVHQFLMGLNDGIYGAVRSNLLATDPLPSLNRVYSTLIQEERVRTITRGREERSEVMGLAVQTIGRGARGRGNPIDKSGMTCTHCNQSGHEIGGCFQLVGYPEWWGDRPKINGKNGGRGKPPQVRGRGGPVRANVVQSGGIGSVSTSLEGNNSGFSGLTNDQWQTLQTLLNNQAVAPSEKMTGEWIIDTGASNHMTGDLNVMCDVHNIESCPVGLPNGQHTLSTKEGSVVLDGNLRITNVLYVPRLNCSLISVSQLSDELNCTVQFTNKLCVMQDRTSRMLIGAGKRKDGLYYFQGIRREKICKTDGVNSVDLWHKRMGHPSMKITQMIPGANKHENGSEFNKACDICFRAKQTREKFPLSEHNACNIFEIIHCDLWGPYRTASTCGAYYFLTIVDDYSRAVWIYLLVDKREVSQTIKNYFSLVERQFHKQIKIFRSDNGTEFTCMKKYFLEHGIIFQTSCTATPHNKMEE
jgi:hypothetical protein